jgi:hypothetical protein
LEALRNEFRKRYIEGSEHYSELVKGLGLVIENTNIFNHGVTADAVYLADCFKLWELEPAVRKVKEAKVYEEGFSYPSYQIKSMEVKENVD